MSESKRIPFRSRSLLLLILVSSVFDPLKRAYPHLAFAYLAPASYFVMLGILAATMNRYRPANDAYRHSVVQRKVDGPLFLYLVRLGVWNRYTYPFFRLLSPGVKIGSGV